MQDEKTIEELVKRLRERVGSLSITVVDLEVLLEVERQKNTDLEEQLSKLKTSSESSDK